MSWVGWGFFMSMIIVLGGMALSGGGHVQSLYVIGISLATTAGLVLVYGSCIGQSVPNLIRGVLLGWLGCLPVALIIGPIAAGNVMLLYSGRDTAVTVAVEDFAVLDPENSGRLTSDDLLSAWNAHSDAEWDLRDVQSIRRDIGRLRSKSNTARHTVLNGVDALEVELRSRLLPKEQTARIMRGLSVVCAAGDAPVGGPETFLLNPDGRAIVKPGCTVTREQLLAHKQHLEGELAPWLWLLRTVGAL
jgi:hypothetical protein